MAEERDLTVPQNLAIKVETSGLYRDDLPPDSEGQPFCLEIAAMLFNNRGAITNQFAMVIRPDNRVTQANALKIHGISERAASQVGIAESRVLGMMSDLLRTPVVTGLKVISYTEFDPKIISSLFARFAVSQGKGPNVYDKLWKTRPLIEFVTLQDPWCTQACKIATEEREDYRRPTLDEAAEIMLGEPKRDGFHDALSGLQKLQRLYFHLQSAGMFGEEAA